MSKCDGCPVPGPSACLYEGVEDAALRDVLCASARTVGTFDRYRVLDQAGYPVEGGWDLVPSGLVAKVVGCKHRESDCHCLTEPATCKAGGPDDPIVVSGLTCLACVRDGGPPP